MQRERNRMQTLGERLRQFTQETGKALDEIQVDLNREYDSMMCKQLLLLLSKLSTDMMDIKLNQYEIKLQLSEMAVAISDTRAKLAKLSET